MKIDTDDLLSMLNCGKSMSEIGKKHNVTRQRIHQLIKKHGIKSEKVWSKS